MVNKHDTSDVIWDLSEFADWEIPALFHYVLESVEESIFTMWEEEDE
jgi:hypothetical protein